MYVATWLPWQTTILQAGHFTLLLYNYRTQKKRMFSLGCFTSVLILMLSGLFGVYVQSINIFWLFRCVPQCIPCFTFFTYHSFYPSPLSQGFLPCPLPPARKGFILEQLKNSCILNLWPNNFHEFPNFIINVDSCPWGHLCISCPLFPFNLNESASATPLKRFVLL